MIEAQWLLYLGAQLLLAAGTLSDWLRSRPAALVCLGLLALAGAAPASAQGVHKCVVNGVTTIQQMPCPSGPVQAQPTVEQLNAIEKKRRQTQPLSPPAAPIAPAANRSELAGGTSVVPRTSPITVAPAPVPAAYRCDGRRYCSQMSSCAEAKYFLANCPGVKMDGDRDGIPCEEQWCQP